MYRGRMQQMVNLTNLDSSSLSTNDSKGYLFEAKMQELLANHNVPFEGNPLEPKAWKKNIAKGSDIKLPSLDMEIECKFVTVNVWSTSINYHYIPRFSLSRYKIIVTNDLTKYSSKCKELLRKNGIKLLNPIYLMQLINRLKLCYGKANTISCSNCHRLLNQCATLRSFSTEQSGNTAFGSNSIIKWGDTRLTEFRRIITKFKENSNYG